MKKIHYIILLLLMPLALGAQSISPTCRTCGKKIALYGSCLSVYSAYIS